jgi:hypothetical protein
MKVGSAFLFLLGLLCWPLEILALNSFGKREGLRIRLKPNKAESKPSSHPYCAAKSPIPQRMFRNYTYTYGDYNATIPEAALARSQRNFGSERLRGFLCKLFSKQPVKVTFSSF